MIAPTGSPGGGGGYQGELPLNGTGSVNANGGDGSAYIDPGSKRTYSTAGGSGGRVCLPLCASVLPDGKTGLVTSVRGGYSSDNDCHVDGGCECGSAGSQFYTTCEGNGPTMVIDNGGLVSKASSLVAAKTQSPSIKLDTLHVTNGAQLQEPSYRNVTATSQIVLNEDARVVLQQGQALVTQDLSITSAEVMSAEAMARRDRARFRLTYLLD